MQEWEILEPSPWCGCRFLQDLVVQVSFKTDGSTTFPEQQLGNQGWLCWVMCVRRECTSILICALDWNDVSQCMLEVWAQDNDNQDVIQCDCSTVAAKYECSNFDTDCLFVLWAPRVIAGLPFGFLASHIFGVVHSCIYGALENHTRSRRQAMFPPRFKLLIINNKSVTN